MSSEKDEETTSDDFVPWKKKQYPEPKSSSTQPPLLLLQLRSTSLLRQKTRLYRSSESKSLKQRAKLKISIFNFKNLRRNVVGGPEEHGNREQKQKQSSVASLYSFWSMHITNRHGGGRQCLWGQLGSQFGVDGSPPCDNTARGKIGLCTAHTAEMQDKCVHGENSSFSYMMQNSDSSISKKGKEIAVDVESVSFNGTYNSVGGNEHSLMSMNNFPLNQNLLIPEGRVHGGGLMAMLRENLVSFEPFARSQTIGLPSTPVACNWV